VQAPNTWQGRNGTFFCHVGLHSVLNPWTSDVFTTQQLRQQQHEVQLLSYLFVKRSRTSRSPVG
jgi:hypothetical protein